MSSGQEEENRCKYQICSKCGETYLLSDLKNLECPKCKVKVEDLEGFYRRHPEFSGKDKS